MPKYQTIFFDLDGTLTQSATGIFNCFSFALEKVGIESSGLDLSWVIGPPLIDSFSILTKGDTEKARECVTLYRSRYANEGIFELNVYPGVLETLEALFDAKVRLCLATSKPYEFAVRIIEHFKMAPYISHVGAADMAGPVEHKKDVLERALRESGANPSTSLMVGDRRPDIDAGRAFGLDTAGVLYGYGSREELVHATYLCASAKDLLPVVFQ